MKNNINFIDIIIGTLILLVLLSLIINTGEDNKNTECYTTYIDMNNMMLPIINCYNKDK